MARWLAGPLVLTTGAVLALQPAAGAQAVPILQTVTIQGEAVVGSTLTAVPVVSNPLAVIEYRWQRCTSDKRADCTRIQKAPDASTYAVVAADEGRRLAVRVVAVSDGAQMAKWSALTSVVRSSPPPVPTPTPTPTPTPDPTSEPEPDSTTDPSTFDQDVDPPLPGTPASPSVKAPSYLRPFPVVRIKGRFVPGGAHVSLLRVTAPRAATVDVRCKGPGCHLRHRSFRGGRRIAALERFLRAGTRITIRVSKPGTVGKYVHVTIRDGRVPKRRDACLLPGRSRPAVCRPV